MSAATIARLPVVGRPLVPMDPREVDTLLHSISEDIGALKAQTADVRDDVHDMRGELAANATLRVAVAALSERVGKLETDRGAPARAFRWVALAVTTALIGAAATGELGWVLRWAAR